MSLVVLEYHYKELIFGKLFKLYLYKQYCRILYLCILIYIHYSVIDYENVQLLLHRL